MAFGASVKFRQYGTWAALLGFAAGPPAILVRIRASQDKPELITGILVSYTDPTLANISNGPNCLGRIQVLKGEPQNEDGYPDPLTTPAESIAAIDQAIKTQGVIELISGGEPIEVPASSIYTVILSAAYLDNDAAGQPSDTIARLTVRGHTKGGAVRLEENYTSER